MPATPKLIAGHIYGPKGIEANATVTLTIGSESFTETSNSSGEYVFNLGDVTEWNVGDTITVTCTVTATGTKIETVTLDSTPAQTVNIFLEQTSDIDYYSENDALDRFVFRVVQLRDYAGNLFSLANPIPIVMENRPLTRKVSQAPFPKYIGEAAPGTPTSEAKWQIRYVTSNGEVTWANGTGKFDKVWDSRASYF